ncbi:TlpA family protein disulfide reductase [Roseiconus lacunae]|uniref:TlpA family protein disulfide reductase n=2 Tax=Roseiconus lacunae TaxID=2605694 RepID=UPI00135C0297|nr:TlpA disulfide reductase family protein [Roseiconus lacunae]
MSKSPALKNRISLRMLNRGFPLLMLVAIGCGGSPEPATTEPTTSPSSSSETVPSASAAEAAQPEPDSASAGTSAAASTTSDPATTSGMQLPDTPLPENSGESTEVDSGKGGLEMPDLNDAAKQESPAVDLRLASWKEVEAKAKSTGKVTVVDLWSTSCAPCIKEFPELVKLHREQGDQIACFAVSVDYDGRKTRPPETYTEMVTEFLASKKAEFPNFLCETPSDEVFSTVDLPSIPAVLVFDEEGNLVKRFIDVGETAGFTYESHVRPFLETLGS